MAAKRSYKGTERRKPDQAHLRATMEAAAEGASVGVYEALGDIMGIDLSTTEGRARARSNFAYIDNLNQACKTMKTAGWKAIVTTGVPTGLYLLWLGIKEHVLK